MRKFYGLFDAVDMNPSAATFTITRIYQMIVRRQKRAQAYTARLFLLDIHFRHLENLEPTTVKPLPQATFCYQFSYEKEGYDFRDSV